MEEARHQNRRVSHTAPRRATHHALRGQAPTLRSANAEARTRTRRSERGGPSVGSNARRRLVDRLPTAGTYSRHHAQAWAQWARITVPASSDLPCPVPFARDDAGARHPIPGPPPPFFAAGLIARSSLLAMRASPTTSTSDALTLTGTRGFDRRRSALQVRRDRRSYAAEDRWRRVSGIDATDWIERSARADWARANRLVACSILELDSWLSLRRLRGDAARDARCHLPRHAVAALFRCIPIPYEMFTLSESDRAADLGITQMALALASLRRSQEDNDRRRRHRSLFLVLSQLIALAAASPLRRRPSRSVRLPPARMTSSTRRSRKPRAARNAWPFPSAREAQAIASVEPGDDRPARAFGLAFSGHLQARHRSFASDSLAGQFRSRGTVALRGGKRRCSTILAKSRSSTNAAPGDCRWPVDGLAVVALARR